MKTQTQLQNENLTFIKLKDLYLSEHNVRTVPASKEEDKLLRASIKAQGITQNLIVIPQGKQYAVIAGGRRLTQLGILLEEGFIKKDYLVPCLLEDEGNISALSLAENIKATMHPADEFMAFQSMIDEGKTIADIANEFGIAQTQVKKRLKLAGVAPDIVQHYRKGNIDLEAVMAFTVCDDHDKQLACYADLSDEYMNAWRIKKYLLDEAISTEDALVKFVTLKDFKKAGGSVTTDLFESVSYINERDLLEKLALEKLTLAAEPLKTQWKWVEISLSRHNTSEHKGRLQAELIDVPKSMTDELQSKQDKLDALYDKPYDEWTEKDETLDDELTHAIASLEEEQEQYRSFAEEQKALSGAVVSIDYQGDITIDYGYVKKEDMAQAFPQDKSKPLNGAEQNSSIESNAHTRDLEHFKLQALQSEVMKDDKLTYDLLIFTLAKSVLGQNGYYSKVVAVDITTSDFKATQGIEETTAAKAIDSYKQTLELSWLSHSNEDEKFAAFRALTSIQKKQLLSYCTALSVSGQSEVKTSINEALSFDIAQHWSPSKENYYSRIKAKDLLAIGTEKLGAQWAAGHAKLPKAKLVEHLSSHKDMADWMPQSMA